MLSRAYKSFLGAINRGNLPSGLQKRVWRWWYQGLAVGWRDRQWTFMNYGWLPPEDVPPFPLEPADEPDRCFIGLYHLLANSLDLEDKRVLEVGSGRGGGSSYFARYHRPDEVIGIDFSAATVRLARRLNGGIPGLIFQQGDAEKLPFADESFDAVVNVESSHCYGDVPAFLREVERVLRPGGRFGWVDIRGKGMMPATREAFANSRLVPLVEQDITQDVLRALDAMHERKSKLIESLRLGRAVARQFSATKDSALYASLKAGKACYLCKVLEKPGDEAAAGIDARQEPA